ncbi:hypothetical protein PHLCEN_2v3057 [Hermanssonia centrifuga]|uniref:Uncharacterized protein n=1 Tax=Hermanssonia centrifuga TaxID=98765 RepID=A0A2R6R7A4_9APHY|nr:hypothetical protein PHLCEN_2v3057 [Hermanssonia centrifuga]
MSQPERKPLQLASPYSWHAPPLPTTFTVPGHTFTTSPDKIWYRKPWAVEAAFSLASFTTPGAYDIFGSCRIHLSEPSASASASQSDSNTMPAETPIVTFSYVREAVKALRFSHPAIACRLAFTREALSSRPRDPTGLPTPEDARLIYEIPECEADVDKWLDEMVFNRVDLLDIAKGDVDKAFELLKRELGEAKAQTGLHKVLFNVHWIPFPAETGQGGILLCCCNHVVFDARAVFRSLNEIVGNIAQIAGSWSPSKEFSWGEEIVRLAGPAVDYGVVPWSIEDEPEVMVTKMRETFTGIPVSFPRPDRYTVVHTKSSQEPYGLAVPHPNAAPSTTGNFFRQLSPEAVKGLVQNARKNGCTFYTVAFAAMALASLRVKPPRRDHSGYATDKELATFVYCSPVDLRPRNLDVKRMSEGNVMSALGFNVLVARDLGRFLTGEEDIWTLAKETRTQLDDQRQYMDRAGFWAHEFFVGGLQMMSCMLGARAARGENPDQTPFMSSIGVIDKYLSPSHSIPSPDELVDDANSRWKLTISNPTLTLRNPYSPYLLFTVGVLSFTWCGTSYLAFSFPEAYMGTAEEQERMAEISLKDKDARGTVLEWVDEFVGILERVAAGESRP